MQTKLLTAYKWAYFGSIVAVVLAAPLVNGFIWIIHNLEPGRPPDSAIGIFMGTAGTIVAILCVTTITGLLLPRKADDQWIDAALPSRWMMLTISCASVFAGLLISLIFPI